MLIWYSIKIVEYLCPECGTWTESERLGQTAGERAWRVPWEDEAQGVWAGHPQDSAGGSGARIRSSAWNQNQIGQRNRSLQETLGVWRRKV